MSTRSHYQNHLSPIYAWMVGDFAQRVHEQKRFFESNGIQADGQQVAVDLGCGHGIQSVALAQLGFAVTAIDFDEHLLHQLNLEKGGLPIQAHQAALLDFASLIDRAGLVVCMGDTLAHLESWGELHDLIFRSFNSLTTPGKLVLSYRDYGHELEDTQRFIPVKADEQKILTCVLEYEEDRVRVTDLLQEKTVAGWQQKASSYYKLRLTAKKVEAVIQEVGFTITLHQSMGNMLHLIAEKQAEN